MPLDRSNLRASLWAVLYSFLVVVGCGAMIEADIVALYRRADRPVRLPVDRQRAVSVCPPGGQERPIGTAVLEHIIVFAVCAPFQMLLGIWNTRKRWLTPGEVRFWGVALFVAAEMIYLGAL